MEVDSWENDPVGNLPLPCLMVYWWYNMPCLMVYTYQHTEAIDGCVWKCCVPLCTQWFCWSLSLLNGYLFGNIPYFQTNPDHVWLPIKQSATLVSKAVGTMGLWRHHGVDWTNHPEMVGFPQSEFQVKVWPSKKCCWTSNIWIYLVIVKI
jgi:hypothetical protein